MYTGGKRKVELKRTKRTKKFYSDALKKGDSLRKIDDDVPLANASHNLNLITRRGACFARFCARDARCTSRPVLGVFFKC